MNSDPKYGPRILMIVGDLTGGIRKHVHDLIGGVGSPLLWYVHSQLDADGNYLAELDAIGSKIGPDNIYSIPIRKSPHWSDLYNLIILISLVSRNNIDIIHGHGAKGGAYARILAMICPGVKSVYTPHGGAVHPMHGLIGNFIYAKIERFLFSATNLCLFESTYSKAEYAKRIGTLANSTVGIVNYNGIATDPIFNVDIAYGIFVGLGFRERYETFFGLDGAKYVNFCIIARIRRIKGHFLLLSIWEEVVRKYPEAILHVVGLGEDSSRLIEAVKIGGLERNIIFYGDVPDARRLLGLFDCCLIPSLFESFGYVAVEAMSEGIPVFASRCGGLIEIVEDGYTGTLLPAGDAPAWRDAVLSFCYSPGVYRLRIPTARQSVVRKFSLLAMVNGVKSAYASLV